MASLILLCLLAAVGEPAAYAQYVGYSLGAAQNGTAAVPIFGVVTNDSAIGNADSILTTVSLGTNSAQGIAVTPDPHPTKIYVTGVDDNSLWVLDVTGLANGKVPTPPNVNQGNVLNLDNPLGIAIAVPSVGPYTGETIAFIANSGTNTITTIDTATNTVVGTPIQLPQPSVGPNARRPISLSVDSQTAATVLSVSTWDGDYSNTLFYGALAVQLENNTIIDNGEVSEPYSAPDANPLATAQTTDGSNEVHMFRFYGATGTNVSTDELFTAACNGSGYNQNQPCIAVFDSAAVNPFPGPISWTYSTACTAQFPCWVNALAAFESGQNVVTVYALVIGDTAGAALYQITINCSLSCETSPVISSPLVMPAGTYSRISLTPDDLLLYISSASFPPPSTGVVIIDDATSFCIAGSSGCGNASSITQGFGPLQIANIDAGSAPIEFLLGGPLPPVVPANQDLSLLALAMANPANSVDVSLQFSSTAGTIDCDQGSGPQPQCTATGNNAGENFVGGFSCYPPSVCSGAGLFRPQHISSGRMTSNQIMPPQNGGGLPPGGVVTITLGGTGNNNTQSSTQQSVNAGASCSLAVSPTSAIAGQTVTSTLTCTAPSGENLSGTITWGDGASSNPTGTTVNNAAVLKATHSYANAGGYTVTGSVQDLTESNAGSVTPGSVSVTVAPPTSCTLSAAPTSLQVGATVTASLACQNIPNGDTLSATVDWGDGSSSPPGDPTKTKFTHAYSAASGPGGYPVSATVADTTNPNNAVNVSPASIAVMVSTSSSGPQAPTITASPTSNAPIQPGQSTQYSLSFSGGSSDANIAFTLTCSGLPTGAACSFSSNTVTLDAKGNGTANLTITTENTCTSLLHPFFAPNKTLFANLFLMFPGLCVLGIGASRKNRRRIGLLLLLMCTLAIGTWTGCGGSSTGPPQQPACTQTPAGSYPITVVATSTSPSLKGQGTVTLVVQ